MQSTPEFEGIILAGVHAWCDGPFETSEARPLVPLAGKPLLCHALGWLRDHGAKRATICANSESPAVRRQLGDGSGIGIDLDYYEDWLPRGTAGCIHDAALGAQADRLVIVDGTLIPEVDLDAMLEQHAARGATLTLAVEAVGQGDLQPVGVHVAERSAMHLLSAVGFQDLKEVAIPNLHRANQRIEAFLADTPSRRVSDAWSYLDAHGWLLEQMQQRAAARPGQCALGASWIDGSAHVDARARLIGPVIIGARTEVQAGVMIVGPVAIGEDCRIESSAVISRSAVWNRCRVGAGSRIDHSILVHDAEAVSLHKYGRAVIAPSARDVLQGRRGTAGTTSRPPNPGYVAPAKIAARTQPGS